MTAACQTCRDLIGGYVLDALDPAEREMVRRHLEMCEPCAREHAALATLPALLDVADSADAVPLRPPPRVEEAVLDRFARERRGTTGRTAPAPEPFRDAPSSRPTRSAGRGRAGWQRRAIPATLAAAACAAVAIALAVVLLGGSDDGGDAPDPAARQSRVYSVSMSGTRTTPRAAGEARLYPGDTGTGVHLVVSGLRPNAYDYELWCVRDDGWKISAGTFRVDAQGRADVQLTAAANPRDYDGLTVQARPRGKPEAQRGTRVLTGRIKQ